MTGDTVITISFYPFRTNFDVFMR